MKLLKDHLYKDNNGNCIYYVSEWKPDGICVEVFERHELIPEIYEDCLFKDQFQLKSILEFEIYVNKYKIKLKDLGEYVKSNFEFREIPGYGMYTNKVLFDLEARLINCVGWFSDYFDEKQKLGILKKKISNTYYIDQDNVSWSIFKPLMRHEIKIFDDYEFND